MRHHTNVSRIHLMIIRREPLPNVSPSEYVVKFFSEGLNERMIDLVMCIIERDVDAASSSDTSQISDDQAHDALYDAIGRAFTVDPDNRPTFKDLRSLLRKPVTWKVHSLRVK